MTTGGSERGGDTEASGSTHASFVRSTSAAFATASTGAPVAAVPGAVHPQQVRYVPTPDNEVPVALGWSAVLGRSADVAVALVGAHVYSTGVRLEIAVRARRGSSELHSAVHGRHGAGAALLLGVAFANGRTATTIGPATAADDAPSLTPGGSSGGGRTVDASFYLAPLPPAGPLAIVCAWPERGIAETTTVLAGEEVQAAAGRVQVLWPPEPEDHSVSEPAPPPDLPAGSWFAQVLEGR